MDKAPFYSDYANAPPNIACEWIKTKDGIRLRVALCKGNSNKTVLIIHGRTEYLEKYGTVFKKLHKRNYNIISYDVRGQGLSDRLARNPLLGHIKNFLDYQRDIDAVLQFAIVRGLPAPCMLMCHSMGGLIGLRALHRGIAINNVIFFAPFWGLQSKFYTQTLKRIILLIATACGYGEKDLPMSRKDTYVLSHPFENNTLTDSKIAYQRLRNQLQIHPDLILNQPSIQWLNSALKECVALRFLQPPPINCLCFVSKAETLVDVKIIKKTMRKWQKGKLIILQNGQHELLQETDHTSQQIWAAIDKFCIE